MAWNKRASQVAAGSSIVSSFCLVSTLLTPPAAVAMEGQATAASVVTCQSASNPGYAQYMAIAVGTAVAVSNGVTIGFYDRKNDTTCFTDSDRRFDTASIVKVIIAVALQWRAQVGQPPLENEDKAVRAMIIESDNDAATFLWRELHLKGPSFVNEVISIMGLGNTIPGPGPSFGRTVTTAGDQITLLKILTSPDEEFLERDRREFVLQLMADVIPSQRYGVPVGAPADARVSVKTGYLNGRGRFGFLNVNTHSIGAVRGGGALGTDHDYMMALLSSGNVLVQGIVRVSQAANVINNAKRVRPQ